MANIERNNSMIESALAVLNGRCTQINMFIAERVDESALDSARADLASVEQLQRSLAAFIGHDDEPADLLLPQLVDSVMQLDPLQYHRSKPFSAPSNTSQVGLRGVTSGNGNGNGGGKGSSVAVGASSSVGGSSGSGSRMAKQAITTPSSGGISAKPAVSACNNVEGMKKVNTASPGPEGMQQLQHNMPPPAALRVTTDSTTPSTAFPTSTRSVSTTPSSPARVEGGKVNNPTGSRRSRSIDHSGPTFADYAGVEALTVCSAVVKLKDGTYVELRCNICHGNSSWVHSTYNKGVRGFQSHLRQVHEENVDPETVLQRCTYRVVPLQEADRIMSGDEVIDVVPCQQKLNIGRNVEYVGNSRIERKPKKKRGNNAGEYLAAAASDAEDTIDDTDHTSPATPARRGRRARPAAEADESNDDGNNDNFAPMPAEIPTKRVRDVSVDTHDKCKIYAENGMADDGKSKKYIELRCDICGGNGSFGSGKFMDGIKGFKMHLYQIHKVKHTTAEIMQHCFHRDIPAAELKELDEGNQPWVGFIRCEGSPNVRPKESYKTFDSAQRT